MLLIFLILFISGGGGRSLHTPLIPDIRLAEGNDDNMSTGSEEFSGPTPAYTARKAMKNIVLSVLYITGVPYISANIYCNYETFPVQIFKITVQNCGNF